MNAVFNVPREGTLPEPAWTEEGVPLPEGTADGDALIFVPKKLGVVIPLSRELWLDSGPSALDAVGNMIAKAMAKKLDRTAYQGDVASGWTGLTAQPGVTPIAFVAGNLDSFKDAQGTVLGAGALSMVTIASRTRTAW
jgi:HK97 family phage major capsid protein